MPEKSGIRSPEVVTLGCRLNAYESEVMRRSATAAGLANAVIVNTCAVTAEAVRQSMQTVRRKRKDHPDAKIIVTGCAAQIEPDRFADMAEVDHVIGNSEKMQNASFADIAQQTTPRVRVNDIMEVRETASHLVDGFTSRARAYVQVQNGCDHRCTFCVIPFGRGPSRSVAAGEVITEIRKLVANGFREVVLTGVDITSYGVDLPGSQTLGKLVKQILRHVTDLERLRLSSIDQVEIDEDLFEAIGDNVRLMPHLHLSLQSGDDLTLKRMKRRHLRADAIAFCRKVRDLRPDVVFGADLIAGFPTETDAMFANTLDIVDECGLTFLHVFPYSKRPGTPAAKMPQVDGPVIKARAAELRRKGASRLVGFLQAQIGARIDVLAESANRGRTPHFATVSTATSLAAGSILPMQVVGHDGQQLIAEPVS